MSEKKNVMSKIIIKSLPPEFNHKSVSRVVRQFGTVCRIYIPMSKAQKKMGSLASLSKSSRCMCVVTFKSEESASEAVRGLDKYFIGPHQLKVTHLSQ